MVSDATDSEAATVASVFSDENFLLGDGEPAYAYAPCDSFGLPDDRDNCFFLEAGHRADESLCERIVERSRYFGCLYNVAVQADDPEVCFGISEEGPRALCLMSLASAIQLEYEGSESVSPRAKALCDSLSSDWRAKCFERLALSQ